MLDTDMSRRWPILRCRIVHRGNKGNWKAAARDYKYHLLKTTLSLGLLSPWASTLIRFSTHPACLPLARLFFFYVIIHTTILVLLHEACSTQRPAVHALYTFSYSYSNSNLLFIVPHVACLLLLHTCGYILKYDLWLFLSPSIKLTLDYVR